MNRDSEIELNLILKGFSNLRVFQGDQLQKSLQEDIVFDIVTDVESLSHLLIMYRNSTKMF